MLNVGVIGLGNVGNQIAALAAEELKIPAMAINSSELDTFGITELSRKIFSKDATKTLDTDRVDLSSIFSKFGI